jgi:hypothetical protein
VVEQEVPGGVDVCTGAPSLGASLQAYLDAQPRAPFSWATRHCCHFAGGWVRELTGHDPLAGWPATPTRTAALRALCRRAGTLEAAVSAALGSSLPLALARTGDVALLPGALEGVGTLGIVSGRHVWALDEAGALQPLPLADARCVWRVLP